jgi:hypothetical protein
LTLFSVFFRFNWILVCLCVILINGCATPATPARWNLQFDDNAPLPNLSLVRRVVPRVGTEYRERYFFRGKYASVTSESRFGDPDEEANLGCIYVGLKEALPGIDIVPTGTFWEQVGATHDVIELPQLFIGPLSDRLRGLQADVIVIAYHVRIDLENAWGETLVEGVFSDTDEETAAIISQGRPPPSL